MIKATPGNAPIPGEEFSNLFTVSPNLRGPVFVTVSSDCAWALAFVRFQPEPTPSPG